MILRDEYRLLTAAMPTTRFMAHREMIPFVGEAATIKFELHWVTIRSTEVRETISLRGTLAMISMCLGGDMGRIPLMTKGIHRM